MQKTYTIQKGQIHENNTPISQQKIIELLNQAEMDRTDLQTQEQINKNLEFQLFHFRDRTMKLENIIRDCVKGHRDLKKMAKKFGVI